MSYYNNNPNYPNPGSYQQPPPSQYQQQHQGAPPYQYSQQQNAAYPPAQQQQQYYPQPDQKSQYQAQPPPPQPRDQAQASGGQPQADESMHALQAYGSPYAHSKDWAATPQDANLSSLPQQAFKMRLKQRFARSPGDVFNPPAPSFSRPPAPNHSYSPFNPISLPPDGKFLADGFKPLYPGRILADHDVSAADWARFLEDIVVAGRLTGGQQVLSNIAPVTMHMGATGFFITRAIEKGMKRKKQPLVVEAIEVWQQTFFSHRRLDVYVKDVTGRLTARAPGEEVPQQPLPPTTEAPAPPIDPRQSMASQRSFSTLSSDSDDSRTTKEQKKQLRKQRKDDKRAARKESKEERRARKKERKQRRKDRKNNTCLLVISPL
ncbi:hypothetical protein IE53DRAFT_371326 [Violaceomyces palustris]|uniref:Uncharacterized protein n=1 Tax=Violaceomyces palustris TaxID=1673888 RepID=A0ACD0NP87_9BASI|nr:hypothetical protein IE53DRAFT_371326 [Violaceomyces palustris]